MKHITKILILILAVLLLGGLLAACTPDTPPVDDGAEWLHNSYIHWQVGDNGETLNRGDHSGGTATYDSKPICDVCGNEYGEHLHKGGEWMHNSSYHWKSCECGANLNYEEHSGGTATYESGPICEVCGKEYGKHLHQFDATGYDDTSHWNECACGQKAGKERHSGVGVGTIGDPRRVCEECGHEYTVHVHQGQGEWLTSEERHWKLCFCGEECDYSAHFGGFTTSTAGPICEACGVEYGPPGTSDFDEVRGLMRGILSSHNDFVSIIMPENSYIDPFRYITNKVDNIVSVIYMPLYWVYYLRENGYPETANVVQSEKQIIGYILDGVKIQAVPLIDVEYTAYDKNGNIIKIIDKDGINPVTEKLKEMLSTVYDIRSGNPYVGGSTLKMDGSTSTIPLEVAFRTGYYGESKEIATETVVHNTTYGSFYNLQEGKCDLIFTTPLSAAQREEAKNRGIDLAEVPICMEAFVFVINANNPVEELTVQQLKDIYSGKITNWKDVGGNDAPIEAFQRNLTSGSQNYMMLFMGDTPLMEPSTEIVPATMEGLVDVLANYDNALNSIGYSVYSYAANMYVDAGKIKFIKVNGIAPTPETMGDLTYPLLNYNYAIYDKNNSNPEIKEMVDWIISEEGQQAVMEGGYVPLQGGELPGYVMETILKFYEATGTGREATTERQDGMASYVSIPVKVEYPENYEKSSLAYHHSSNSIYPIIFGAKYTIDGLVNEELEKEINDFIATAVAEVESKFPEMYKAFIEHRLAGEYIALRHSSSMVEVSGKNGYISIVVSNGYENFNADAEFIHRYHVITATYDLRTGKRVESLSDLFPQDLEFMGALTDDLLYDINYLSTSYYSRLYGFYDDFIALAEKESLLFTYNTIIFPVNGRFAQYGCELSFSADSLVTEYCDMKQFFTEDFEGRITESRVNEALGRENFISIGGSSNSGVYYPADANSALEKVARYLAEHIEQFVSEEIALKMYCDAGHAEVVTVEYTFPIYLPTKVGDVYYRFDQCEDAWENIYYAYDAQGNIVSDENVMVGYEDLRNINHPYYFYQDTGEPVIVTLKDGWEESAKLRWHSGDIPFSSKYGDEDVIDIFYIDFWTGECLFTVNGDFVNAQIVVPLDYIALS